MPLLYAKTTMGGYMFDVIFKENYQFENTITQNPVQSGANINDHVYQQPVEISFDIGMSDCLTSGINGQFTTLPSRSASAFQILYSLWKNATVMTVNTYLNGSAFDWPNMLIKSMSVLRDKTTHNAIRATVTLQQIIVTNAVDLRASEKTTSNNQVVNQTTGGAKTASTTLPGGVTIGGTFAAAIK